MTKSVMVLIMSIMSITMSVMFVAMSFLSMSCEHANGIVDDIYEHGDDVLDDIHVHVKTFPYGLQPEKEEEGSNIDMYEGKLPSED